MVEGGKKASIYMYVGQRDKLPFSPWQWDRLLERLYQLILLEITEQEIQSRIESPNLGNSLLLW